MYLRSNIFKFSIYKGTFDKHLYIILKYEKYDNLTSDTGHFDLNMNKNDTITEVCAKRRNSNVNVPDLSNNTFNISNKFESVYLWNSRDI